MPVTRQDLDLQAINRELHRGTPYTVIAYKEAERLGVDPSLVSRSMISGIHRDLKNGKLEISSAERARDRWVSTYRYGIDKDNGGIPIFVGHPQLDGDAVVISDPHFPEANYQEVERVNEAGQYYGLKRLIIAGDMLDAGGQGGHRRKIRATPISVGFDVGKAALEFWAKQYDEIWFLPGNHDDWLLENLEGDITITQYARMLGMDALGGKLIVTNYDRIHLYSGGSEWVIPHQRESSVNWMGVLEKLSWKYEANIVGPHQHKTGWTYDRYNRYLLVAIGGLHEQSMMGYVNLKTSTKPTYNSGFVAIKDGEFDLIVPDKRYSSRV